MFSLKLENDWIWIEYKYDVHLLYKSRESNNLQFSIINPNTSVFVDYVWCVLHTSSK